MAERRIGKYERLAIERQKRDLALARQQGGHPRGLWYDAAAGERVVEFIEKFCRHHKGEWAGNLIELQGWQKDRFIRPLFGWKRADGTRRFRTGWIEIARKNTKTTSAAGCGLYLMVGDGEPGAEIYCTATKEAQAKILHRDATAMVKASPELKRFVRVYRNNLSCARLGSKFEPLGADSTTLDGLNPHGHIPDEVHAHKDHGVWNVLDTGMGARRQPLTLAITTAGTYDKESVGWQKHEYATQVLEGFNGSFEDDSFFAYVAAIDDDDDPFDPANWGKANPSLNVSIRETYLAEQAVKAQRDPTFYNDFLRLHLNRWVQQETRWLSVERWRDCDPVSPERALETRAQREEALAGRECYAGLDLSSRLDLTALVLAFQNPDGTFDLVCRFWLPEETIREHEKKGKRMYAQWEREGWLTATPGEIIDYGFIRAELGRLREKFQITEVAMDPHNATQIATELREQDGFTTLDFQQGFKSMSEPSKAFEALIVARKIRHGGHPILRWNVGNAAVRRDPAGGIKPDKDAAKDKIDGLVAAIMATGRATLSPGGSGGSYLDEGPLLTV